MEYTAYSGQRLSWTVNQILACVLINCVLPYGPHGRLHVMYSEAVTAECVFGVQKQLRSTACYVFRSSYARLRVKCLQPCSHGQLRLKYSEAVTVDYV